ncbi:hypothetical protein JKP88DRAFT_280297 [Tribonema minus]|uniref:EGF-like domain-containing protein n=1 Tax=Tribonema minus TaxID=303371 RepID=A0A836CBW0_9STRA|nr:hypothetical protein JKP88DRAFT_280297 [Tribonema minus]
MGLSALPVGPVSADGPQADRLNVTRHNLLADALFQLLKQVAHLRGLDRDTLAPFRRYAARHGFNKFMDIVFGSNQICLPVPKVQPSADAAQGGARDVQRVLESASQEKIDTYVVSGALDPTTHTLFSAAFDHFGAMSCDTQALLHALAEQSSQGSYNLAQRVAFWRRRTSLALQRALIRVVIDNWNAVIAPDGDRANDDITHRASDAMIATAAASQRLDIGCNRGVLTVTQVDMGAGLCPLLVCCPKNCPLCANRANCLKNAKNPSCCPEKDIAATLQRIDTGLSDIEVSCRYKAPPCTMPPADDPCVGQHGDRVVCLRNARCGVRYVSDDPGYVQEDLAYYALGGVQGTTTSTDNGCIGTEFYCECAKDVTGSRCERKCKKGQTACGYEFDPYRSKDFRPNDIARNAPMSGYRHTVLVCERVGEKYGFTTKCLPKGHPKKCSPSPWAHPQLPDPCQNGGKCVNINSNQVAQYAAYLCDCAKGFHGPLCQYKDK